MVLRNKIMVQRWERMREELGNMKDIDMFKTIRHLKGKKTIPPIRKNVRTKAFDHDKISDMIVAQLNPSETEVEYDKSEIELNITNEEIEYGIKTSPRNTANGIDGMSYPFVRFWQRVDEEIFNNLIRYLARVGCRDRMKAETVLIRKGDEETYEVVK